MIFAADSHDVWIAFFACVSVGFGCLNVWLQQRNKNVTVTKTNELTKAIAENTELTKDAADKAKKAADKADVAAVKAEDTHRMVQQATKTE